MESKRRGIYPELTLINPNVPTIYKQNLHKLFLDKNNLANLGDNQGENVEFQTKIILNKDDIPFNFHPRRLSYRRKK